MLSTRKLLSNVLLLLALLPGATPAQTSWQVLESGTDRWLWGVWGESGSSVRAVGDAGTILRSFGNTWTSESGGGEGNLCDVWGATGNDIIAVGLGGVLLRNDGTQWNAESAGTAADLFGVWSGGADDAWVVGALGTLLRWDGTSWSAIPTGTLNGLYGVWGAGDGGVFVVGALGTVMRFDGTTWTTETVGSQSISDVFGFASNDVWAVGDGGMLLHYDGTAWSIEDIPTAAPALSATISENLYAVWGSAADDVFVVGQGGVIFHFDGDAWQAMDSPVTVSLFNVWGSGPMNVYAVGEAGTLLRYGEDGTVPVLFRRFTASTAQGAVSLAWEVYADEHVDGYLVYREAVDPASEAVLLTPRALDPASRGWIDTTAQPGQRYRYTLVALGRESGRVVSAPAEVTVRAVAARLEQNHPNPFNPATTIEWNTPSAGRLTLRVYGVDGRLVRTLVDGNVRAGRGGVVWDGRDDAGGAVASGVYFYRLRSGAEALTRKMILAK